MRQGGGDRHLEDQEGAARRRACARRRNRRGLTPATPDQVSTATGKAVVRPIRKIEALQLDGKAKKAIGSQAIDGSGPIRRMTGWTQ